MVNEFNEKLLAKINERIIKKLSTKTKVFDDLIKVGTRFNHCVEDYEDLGYEILGGTINEYYVLIEKDNRYAIIETDIDWKPLKEDEIFFYLDEDNIANNVGWFLEDMYWWN